MNTNLLNEAKVLYNSTAVYNEIDELMKEIPIDRMKNGIPKSLLNLIVFREIIIEKLGNIKNEIEKKNINFYEYYTFLSELLSSLNIIITVIYIDKKL